MPREEEMLRACLAGDPGAWDAFVERFAAPLAEACRHALRRCDRPAGPQEADDMVQAVFLDFLDRGMRVLRGYRGRGSLEAYLATVAVRRVLADRTLPRRPPPGPQPLEERGDPAPGPAATLEGRETLEQLGREMQALAPRAQLALTLQADGASLEEIAGVLGLSYEAAGQILSRAKATLRERLK